MKIILLAAGGRAGADFLHSLIDGHSQILNFPGYLRINNDFKNLFYLKNRELIADQFIKTHLEFFDSKVNKFERWNKLGTDKKSFFKVKKKIFKQYFVKLSKTNDSKLELLKKLHLAYFMAKKQKINNLKVLFIHTHLLSWTKEFIKFFNLKKFDIIHTIRHPLAALSSQQKSWLNYKKGTNYFPKDLFYHLDTVVNCINNLKKLGKVNIIQLERLHTKNLIVMKNFCKKFQIKYENCLKISSKNNLKWWGDAVSARPLSGINTKHKVIINEKLFYNRDLVFFQNLTKEILKSYKYPFFFEKKNITFNFFPMKCEIIVWKNTLKNIFHNGFRWKHILSIPFFYILRILLINSIITNNRKPFLPKSL